MGKLEQHQINVKFRGREEKGGKTLLVKTTHSWFCFNLI